MDRKPVIAITMGDPTGVGPVIVAKSLAREAVQQSVSALVVGDPDRLRVHAALHGLACEALGDDLGADAGGVAHGDGDDGLAIHVRRFLLAFESVGCRTGG